MAQIPRTLQTMQQTEKKMVFKSLNPWWTIHAFLAYIISYFGQVKNYAGQVEIIHYLHGMAS